MWLLNQSFGGPRSAHARNGEGKRSRRDTAPFAVHEKRAFGASRDVGVEEGVRFCSKENRETRPGTLLACAI